jgi:hypothetical protein
MKHLRDELREHREQVHRLKVKQQLAVRLAKNLDSLLQTFDVFPNTTDVERDVKQIIYMLDIAIERAEQRVDDARLALDSLENRITNMLDSLEGEE